MLEVVLLLALVSATVFGLVRTVFSPVALGSNIPAVVRDAGGQIFGPRYFGEVPAVRTELNQGVMVTTTPPLYFYGRDEVPVGRGEFSGPYEAQVNAYSPTASQRTAFVALASQRASRPWRCCCSCCGS